MELSGLEGLQRKAPTQDDPVFSDQMTSLAVLPTRRLGIVRSLEQRNFLILRNWQSAPCLGSPAKPGISRLTMWSRVPAMNRVLGSDTDRRSNRAFEGWAPCKHIPDYCKKDHATDIWVSALAAVPIRRLTSTLGGILRRSWQAAYSTRHIFDRQFA